MLMMNTKPSTFRMFGNVIDQSLRHQPAPSMAAASKTAGLIEVRPARSKSDW